jgi:hypothetical protein
VARFVSDRAKELGGMVDLEAHKVSDLTEAIDFAGRRVGMNEKSSMGLAVKELLKPASKYSSERMQRQERRPA